MEKKKLFDFCIGNPPYQDETIGDNKTYAPPVYNLFLDEANKVASATEMVHPARFLFNAGSTPKSWNEKMLNDPHFKILQYDADSKNIFPGLTVPLKGGVAISYHDDIKEFGAIQIFTEFPELNSILKNVIHLENFESISTIITTSYAYHFTDSVYQAHPDARGCLSSGHAYDFKSNVFEKMPMVFYTEKPNNGAKYIRVLGRLNNQRTYRYIEEEYINQVDNLHSYKLFLSGAMGTGTFGETIANPILGLPGDSSTETFMSLGNFKTQTEALYLEKYIKTKFARTLFDVLKKTQANTPGKWKYVPLQDFTSASDIDWSKSIHEIDLQLYKKYNLSTDGINFIETHVKEMA